MQLIFSIACNIKYPISLHLHFARLIFTSCAACFSTTSHLIHSLLLLYGTTCSSTSSSNSTSRGLVSPSRNCLRRLQHGLQRIPRHVRLQHPQRAEHALWRCKCSSHCNHQHQHVCRASASRGLCTADCWVLHVCVWRASWPAAAAAAAAAAIQLLCWLCECMNACCVLCFVLFCFVFFSVPFSTHISSFPCFLFIFLSSTAAAATATTDTTTTATTAATVLAAAAATAARRSAVLRKPLIKV